MALSACLLPEPLVNQQGAYEKGTSIYNSFKHVPDPLSGVSPDPELVWAGVSSPKLPRKNESGTKKEQATLVARTPFGFPLRFQATIETMGGSYFTTLVYLSGLSSKLGQPFFSYGLSLFT